MQLAVIIPFQNEEAYLQACLDSVAAQTRPPDCLLLVDDGSTDCSSQIAEAFVGSYGFASLLRLPPRPTTQDRLMSAAPLIAFRTGLEDIDISFDILCKMDADLRLTPRTLADIEASFAADTRLGIAGAYLSIRKTNGRRVREEHAANHVRGATKFYRRRCYEEIMPFPAIVGWDTIDEIEARRKGWRTISIGVSSGDPEHMRPTGSFDGVLRGNRRSGLGVYAWGAHPGWVLLNAGRRVRNPPVLLGSLSYIAGWALAILRRAPRASPEVRRFARQEQTLRLRQCFRRWVVR